IAENISNKIASMRKNLELVDPPKEKSTEEEIQDIAAEMGGETNVDFAKNTNESIVTGGARSTNITINFKNLIETIMFNGSTQENQEEMQRNIAEGVFRALNMAQSSVS
nr:hypothetical protein [Bacteroidales bacterium]